MLGIEKISIFSISSILLTLIGVFVISDSKLKIKYLQKDLFIRIATALIMSYVTHFILQYWSNAVFLFLMNLLLTLLFSRKYNLEYHKRQKKIIKWIFVQQLFGFFSLYMSNYLASNSVTLSSYVRPASIIIVVIIAMFFKDKERKPKIKQILGILLIIIGIIFIN